MKKGLLAVLTLAVFLTGCPKIDVPPNPPPAGGVSPHPGFFRHSVRMSWSGVDLADLRSMIIEHAGDLELRTDVYAQDLNLLIQADIQLENHDQLAAEFSQRLAEQSEWAGAEPKVIVPDPAGLHPSYACFESQREPGRDDPPADDPDVLRGICVRSLVIVLPPKKHMELDLSWKGQALVRSVESPLLTLRIPEEGGLRVDRVRGKINLRGGGANSSALIEKIMPSTLTPNEQKGDIQARLSRMSKLELRDVMGSVYLSLEHPSQSTVTLDGKKIERFPFFRP